MQALQVTPMAWEEITAASPLLRSPGAGLGYTEHLLVPCLQLPAAGWWVMQSHKPSKVVEEEAPGCKRS